jgi:hypothetical protein
MVTITVLNDRDEPTSYSCRFCEKSAQCYHDVLCHELELHFSGLFSCRECPPALTSFIDHLKKDHRRVSEEDAIARFAGLNASDHDVPSHREEVDEKPVLMKPWFPTWDSTYEEGDRVLTL